MAGTSLDLRKADLRSNVLETPYWITSGEMTKACDDQDAVLFSFPVTTSIAPGYGTTRIIVQEVCLEVVTAFIGGTLACMIGLSSLLTDAVTTAGTTTDVNENAYWEATDGAADIAAVGRHFPTNGSTWVTSRVAGVGTSGASGYVIIPADAAVQAVTAVITSNSTITAGSAYFHMLISVVPSVAAA